MTQILETPPREDQRRSARIIAAVVAGILTSIVGVGVMALALGLYTAAGTDPTWNQAAGYLFIALAGFLVSTAGTDLRVNAWRR
jgi:cytochrome c biogenesis protein CcdA